MLSEQIVCCPRRLIPPPRAAAKFTYPHSRNAESQNIHLILVIGHSDRYQPLSPIPQHLKSAKPGKILKNGKTIETGLLYVEMYMPWFSRKADQSLRPLEDCVAGKYSIQFYMGCAQCKRIRIDAPLPNLPRRLFISPPSIFLSLPSFSDLSPPTLGSMEKGRVRP